MGLLCPKEKCPYCGIGLQNIVKSAPSKCNAGGVTWTVFYLFRIKFGQSGPSGRRFEQSGIQSSIRDK